MKIKGTYDQTNHVFQTSDSTVWTGWFNEGVALFSKGGRFGLIDPAGNIICTPQYDRIFNFQGNVAVVCRDNKYGLLSKNGKELVAPIYSFISDFTPELAWFYNASDHSHGLLTKGGQIISTPDKTVIRKVQGQYIFSTITSHTLLSSSGKPIYTINVNDFDGAKGHCRFADDKDPWLRYDENEVFLGRQRINNERGVPLCNSVSPDLPFFFNDGLATVPENIAGTIKMGYIDRNGKIAIPCTYDNAHHFLNGLACVEKDRKWGVIDKTGKLVIPYAYEYLENTGSGYFIFTKSGMYGVIAQNETVVIAPNYLNAKYLFKDVFALLENNGAVGDYIARYPGTGLSLQINTWGAVNAHTGKPITSFKYQNIEPVNDLFGVAIQYAFEDSAIHTGPENFPTIKSSRPIREYNGYARCDLFNALTPLGTYSSSPVSFYDNLSPDNRHLENIFPFRQTGDRFLFGTQFIGSEGEPVNPGLAQHNKSNQMRLVAFTDPVSRAQGIKDLADRIVLAPQFSKITIGSTGFIAEKNHLCGFFDLTGKELIPCTYNFIEETPSGILKVTLNSLSFLIDKTGKKLI